MRRDYTDEESIRIRTELFNRYVWPHRNLIFKLCIKYSFNPMDIEDNYNEVLINCFKYIDTYNPEKPIQTWLHVVTKRFVMDLNYRQRKYSVCERVDVENLGSSLSEEDQVTYKSMSMDNYREFYNDDILYALDQINPIFRNTLLLQQAGYKLDEIMDISHKEGNLKTRNIETVKSRSFLARKRMGKLINRDGLLIR